MRGLIEHFSTGAAVPERRLDYWNQLASESSAGLSVDSENRNFEGHLQRWRIGELTLIRVRAERSKVRRAAIGAGAERLRVHLQLAGVCRQRHLGREALLRPGDISICSSAAPAWLETGGHEMLVMDISRAALEARVSGLEEHFGCPTQATSPAAHSFAQYATALWREADGPVHSRDASWQADGAAILLDLLGLAVRSSARGGMVRFPAPMDRIRAIIEARLGDPELGAGMIARELGVSVRTVQYWFAQSATTLARHIQSRRLARAAERLAGDPRASITEVAFDVGFSDASHFTRCFRKEFGVPPGAWRRQH